MQQLFINKIELEKINLFDQQNILLKATRQQNSLPFLFGGGVAALLSFVGAAAGHVVFALMTPSPYLGVIHLFSLRGGVNQLCKGEGKQRM